MNESEMTLNLWQLLLPKTFENFVRQQDFYFYEYW